jgi:hypothetical protein
MNQNVIQGNAITTGYWCKESVMASTFSSAEMINNRNFEEENVDSLQNLFI